MSRISGTESQRNPYGLGQSSDEALLLLSLLDTLASAEIERQVLLGMCEVIYSPCGDSNITGAE